MEMNSRLSNNNHFQPALHSSDASTGSSGRTTAWVPLHTDMSTETMGQSLTFGRTLTARIHFDTTDVKQPKYKQEQQWGSTSNTWANKLTDILYLAHKQGLPHIEKYTH